MKPTDISIMGINFKIIHKKLPKDHYGETDLNKRQIAISSAITDDDVYEDTLLHEIIHAVLGVTGQSERLEENVEESLVVALEHGLSRLYCRRSKKVLDK